MGQAQSVDEAEIDRKLILDDDGLSIWRQVLQPGEVTPWHWHQFVTDNFIVGSGALSVDTDGEASMTTLAVGDHVAVRPETRHRVRNVGTQPATFITVQTGGRRDFILVNQDAGHVKAYQA